MRYGKENFHQRGPAASLKTISGVLKNFLLPVFIALKIKFMEAKNILLQLANGVVVPFGVYGC